MTFDAAMPLEVLCEFAPLQGVHWERVEDALWLRRQREHAAWAEHGKWWRKTAGGRRYGRECQRERATRLRKRVVAVAVCKGCGKPFERTAYDAARKRGRVCSTACRGRSRGNIELVEIGGKSQPLARWAEHYGIKLQTVWKRMKLGWSPLQALTTPIANRGQERR